MTISYMAAKELALLGCNLTIPEDSGYSYLAVKEIAAVMGKGYHLTVNVSKYSPDAIKEIIKAASGQITVVL